MAKKTLFTPEDFDKPSKSKGGLWKKSLIGLAFLAVIVAAWWMIYAHNNEETSVKNDQPKTEEVVTQPNDSIGADSATEVAVEEPTVEILEETQETAIVKEPQQTPSVSNDVEKEAMNVIRGDYGNNPQRKLRLGASYQFIQNRVNQLKKEGVF